MSATARNRKKRKTSSAGAPVPENPKPVKGPIPYGSPPILPKKTIEVPKVTVAAANRTGLPEILFGEAVQLATTCWHVLVTPALAVELLSINEDNRRVARNKVVEWANVMRQGRWRNTHQAIAIDDDGNVLDGQHRLHAVVETGIPVWMRVWFGESRDVFPVLDRGANRMAAQFVDVKNATVVTAAAKLLAVIDNTTDAVKVEAGIKPRYDSMENNIESFERWRAELTRNSSACVSVYHATRINSSMLLATVAMASQTQYADQIEEFLVGLKDGIGFTEGDPRAALRQRWAVGYRELSTTQRRSGMATVIKAWNYYVEQQPVRQLRIGPNEPMPRVVGWVPKSV